MKEMKNAHTAKIQNRLFVLQLNLFTIQILLYMIQHQKGNVVNPDTDAIGLSRYTNKLYESLL